MKKVIAIFLAAILIFSLAACGGTSGDTNSKTETSTSETKTGDTSSANNTSTDGKTLIVENIPFEETRSYVERVESTKEKYHELYD